MLTLPRAITSSILPFAELFPERVFEHAKSLVVGAILALGRRTVTSILQVLGKSSDAHFQNFHRVLNRDRWSPMCAGRRLLSQLIETFAPARALVFGLDETIERRRGEKISAKRIYRDQMRSPHSHFVKASSLRWLSLMLVTRVPGARYLWALPVLSVLTPSNARNRHCGRHYLRGEPSSA